MKRILLFSQLILLPLLVACSDRAADLTGMDSATDARRTSASKPPIAGAARASSVQAATIVPYGSGGFRYVDGTHGHAPVDGAGRSFEDPDFDDSAWQDGVAPFGFKGGICAIENEIQTQGWLENHDLLVRRVFDLPDGSSGLQVAVAIDNDIRVWLNGEDISGGLRVHEGCATRNSFVFDAPDRLLRTGENVLAVRARDRGISAFLDVEVRTEETVDAVPPAVVSVQVIPESVDLAGDRNIEITASAFDATSGVVALQILLQAPDGSRAIKKETTFEPPARTATWTFAHTFDEGNTITGLWELSGHVKDAAGNIALIVPGSEPPVSSGVLVSVCGEDVERRSGGIENAFFASNETADESLLDALLHGQLDEIRRLREEMEEFQGWDEYLVGHDIKFRTKFCEALRWLPLARKGNDDARLLFVLARESLDRLDDALVERLSTLERLLSDLEVARTSERYEELLKAIAEFDRGVASLLPPPGERRPRQIQLTRKVLKTLEEIVRGIAKLTPARLIGFVLDLKTTFEAVDLVADWIELDVLEEARLAEFLEIQQALTSLELLRLHYIELGTQERRLSDRLSKALSRGR